MSFKLENLEYQEQAIQSVVDIFHGQIKSQNFTPAFDGIFWNTCTLSSDQILDNIKNRAIQNGISDDIAFISDRKDITIEMETGTGKTLVYIQTLYRLYQEYWFTKFIILVPTVPIRAWVLSTLSIFQEQLREKYGFSIPYFEYDSKKISRIDSFIRDNNPEIMVMTLQSFTSDDRIINQTWRDKSFDGMSYFQALSACRPIIIMDEPQEGMDTENAQNRLKDLRPLFTLRYSATHKKENIYNRIFRLTPYDAYSHGIVKKLEILSVVAAHDEANMRMIVEGVETQENKKPSITMNLWCLNAENDFVMKSIKNITEWTDLVKKTNNTIYQWYTVERIYKELWLWFWASSWWKWRVRFSNGHEIVVWEQWDLYKDFFRLQIKWLIWSHFQKKKKLKPLWIKPLALIFIDKVDNYVQSDWLIKTLFIEEYRKCYEAEYDSKVSDEEIEKVQWSYFAKTWKGDFTDNESTMRSNSDIYKTIMEKKEQLISFSEPIEFVFTHSALGVGWDNPNVFTIATLNQSQSAARKQQEIGRGLRICVNQDWQRIYDSESTPEWEEINVLTIVPNESYKTFSEKYQSETREQYWDIRAPETRDNTKWKLKKQKITRRDDIFASPSFIEFWKRISRKTNYTVIFNELSLKNRAIEELAHIEIPEEQIEVSLTRITSFTEAWIESQYSGSTTEKSKSTFSALDIIEELSESTSLGYKTIFEIISWLDDKSHILRNPPRWISEASKILRNIELEEMLRAIKYDTTDESIDITDVLASFETTKTLLEPTPHHGLYDIAVCDSAVEMDFARDADNAIDIVCMMKLPAAYSIPTPIGPYKPDFGIVMKRRELTSSTDEEYYFVIETKWTNDINDRKSLTPDEAMKIACAKKHFEALGMPTSVRFEAPRKDFRSFIEKIW